MQEIKRRQPFALALRAHLPQLIRAAAVLGLAGALTWAGVSYWRTRQEKPFRMLGGAPQLSTEETSRVYGLERRVMDGDRLQILVKAATDITYKDGHHELEQVYIEYYPKDSEKPDKIQSDRATFLPGGKEEFEGGEGAEVLFNGHVKLENRDGVKAESEKLVYHQGQEVAITDQAIAFSRENISGHANGARLDAKNKKLELTGGVEINVAPGNGGNNGPQVGQPVKINAARADFDENARTLVFTGGATAQQSGQTLSGDTLTGTLNAQRRLQKVETRGNSYLRANNQKGPASEVWAVNFDFFFNGEQKMERAVARQNVRLVNGPSEMRASETECWLTNEKLTRAIAKNGVQATNGPNRLQAAEVESWFDSEQRLDRNVSRGGVTINSDNGQIQAAEVESWFDDEQRIDRSLSRGGVTLRSQKSELRAADLESWFDDEQRLARSVAKNKVTLSGGNAESDVFVSGANYLEADFTPQGRDSVIREARLADGRMTATFTTPKSRANDPRAANKKLVGNQIKLGWQPNGQDLARAEVIGKAELYVEPVRQQPDAERKKLFADRFDADFFEKDNLARTFVATGHADGYSEPLQPTKDKGVKHLTSRKMTAVFQRETQDVDRFDAAGDAKFQELDRNGRAENISYTATDGMMRLRGGEPTVWDSRARVKGAELDSDTVKKISYARGKTSTTYYSQEQTGGAAPFSKTKSPVFATAERSEFRHDDEVAIYTGDARLWQDDNFVRAENITLHNKTKRLDARGSVQTMIYQARKKGEAPQPALATSQAMTYQDAERQIHYEGNVDIRQNTDRITCAIADIYLYKEKDRNEVERTVAQQNVVLTQPGRQGTGDWAQYTATDEIAILRGNPARVTDAENGTQEAGRLTLYNRENRVVGDSPRGSGASPQSTGRVRATHKIKDKP
jgi:lipopolysaccharide export system protein LptA